MGERRRWCYETGDWNWPELGTAECIPERQYHTMQAGITAGIALAVIVPIACVVVCIIQRYTGEGTGLPNIVKSNYLKDRNLLFKSGQKY